MKQNTLVAAIVLGAVCFVIGLLGAALLTMPSREKTRATVAAAEAKADEIGRIAEGKIRAAKAEARRVQTIAEEKIRAAKAEAEHFQNELKSVREKLQEAKTEIVRLGSEAEGKRIAAEQKRVQEQEYPQKQAKLKADLDGLMAALKAAGIDKSIIDRCSAEDDTLTIVVANAWHFQPYQIRLQAAQNLWNLWAKLRSPNDPDKARIELTDYNGNSVGGSRWLAGSLIWVKKK